MKKTVALLFIVLVLVFCTTPVSGFFDIVVDAPMGGHGVRRLLSKGQGRAYGDAPHGPNECHGSDCLNDDCEGDGCRGGSDPKKDDDDREKGKGKDRRSQRGWGRSRLV